VSLYSHNFGRRQPRSRFDCEARLGSGGSLTVWREVLVAGQGQQTNCVDHQMLFGRQENLLPRTAGRPRLTSAALTTSLKRGMTGWDRCTHEEAPLGDGGGTPVYAGLPRSVRGPVDRGGIPTTRIAYHLHVQSKTCGFVAPRETWITTPGPNRAGKPPLPPVSAIPVQGFANWVRDHHSLALVRSRRTI
jgi:hypothetical protein